MQPARRSRLRCRFNFPSWRGLVCPRTGNRGFRGGESIVLAHRTWHAGSHHHPDPAADVGEASGSTGVSPWSSPPEYARIEVGRRGGRLVRPQKAQCFHHGPRLPSIGRPGWTWSEEESISSPASRMLGLCSKPCITPASTPRRRTGAPAVETLRPGRGVRLR